MASTLAPSIPSFRSQRPTPKPSSPVKRFLDKTCFIITDAPSATSLLAHTPLFSAFAGDHTQLTNAHSSQRNTLPEPPPNPNPLHSINKPNKTAVVTPIYIHKLSQFCQVTNGLTI
ncbi:hypothetical protein DPMN_123374 [Dreissena polymorpha]|uniref:Uncharacterized protein n=1 Tax=Dreissena polymorpha TaxID=45954 RepID=A0A9D4GUB0_DREPO|nr:hypothetical protein DPMN_123374 [Dreissena polymorpha]